MSLLDRRFRYSFNHVTLILILINFVVFYLSRFSRDMTTTFALNPILCFHKKMWWQVFTYMFMHGSWKHLLFNMLGLLFFGISVERGLGSKEFLLFYLLTGTLSGLMSLAVYLATGNYGVFLVGASGAVYGVLLAFAVLYPRARIFVFYILPLPAPLVVIGFAAIELFNEVFGLYNGIAHATHLFGFLTERVGKYGVNMQIVQANQLRVLY